MLNESFWIFLSFVLLIGIFLKYVRKGVLSSLDSKIKSVEESIVTAETAKKNANATLLSLKEDYEKALLQYENNINEAKIEAKNIIDDAEARIKSLDESSVKIITEYRKQSDSAMMEALKGDILMTILNLLEAEQKQDKDTQQKGIENSLNAMKKIWN